MRDARSRLVCERVRAQVSLSLDGELSQLEEAMVASHVARCPACREYEQEARATTSALRAAPLEPLEQMIQLPRRRRAPARVLQVGVAAAAVMLAVGLGTMAEALRTQENAGAITFNVKPNVYLDARDELVPQKSVVLRRQGPVEPI